MFKLTYFKATNMIGFMSGLGKKSFTLDLADFKDKDIIVILGDNATGKSTFLSLIHPLHMPSDGRTKFVIESKEGTLIRIYEGDDGTIIETKCIYHPKQDLGHTAKCFLSVKRPGEKEFVEMNPNGNVASYTNLIYTYFGITKDYVNFASYSDAVTNIVTMTDSERKNSIGPLIPNTGRFELAYTTINEKYKELRNLIRNVSQKITSIRDEEVLTNELDQISRALEKADAMRDEYMKKLAVAEGRVKELSHDRDIKMMRKDFFAAQEAAISCFTRLKDIKRDVFLLLHQIGSDDILSDNNLSSIDPMTVGNKISTLQRKSTEVELQLQNITIRQEKIEEERYQIEKDVNESESILFSLQTEDIHELEKMRKEYHDQLQSLQYTRNKDLYENMSYDEIVSFSRSISMVDEMIQSLYDEYGEMVSKLFESMANAGQEELPVTVTSIESLTATIITKTEHKDAIYRQLIEKEQYRKFQDILDQRPISCKIDTCPFIATALKWKDISREIDDLKSQYQQLNIEIGESQQMVLQYERELALREHAQNLTKYIRIHEKELKKYLDITVRQLYLSISRGTWTELLDMIKLKKLAVILSEKELYIKITTQLLPQTENSIMIAKTYGENRDKVQAQIKRLKKSLISITTEYETLQSSRSIGEKMRKLYRTRLITWIKVQSLLEEYRELLRESIDAEKSAKEKEQTIRSIQTIIEECQRYEIELKSATDVILELTPRKQQVQTDINMLLQLKLEKEKIEHDFLIVEVMRSIIQPGKGLRKELINLYMHEIYTVTNQLLLNTFNGRLRLLPFIITDKEFIIPYEYSGAVGNDISYASSSQKSTISMTMSLAIISQMIGKYSIIGIDEADQSLSPENKSQFVDIITKQMSYIGISQAFIITHSPDYYLSRNVGAILFPGAKANKKELDCIKVDN